MSELDMEKLLADTQKAVDFMNRIVVSNGDWLQLQKALEQPAEPSETLKALIKGEG